MKTFNELEKLAKSFEKLPGVGKKTALRYAYAILDKFSENEVNELANELINVKTNIKECPICGLKTFIDVCYICNSLERDRSKILVVKDSKDALVIEKTNKYNGLYHVLGNLILRLMVSELRI